MKKQLVIAGIVAGAIIGAAGVSMAVTGWGVSGTAKATGSIGSITPTTGVGVVDGSIFPNHSNDCDITFTNPNSVDVVITEVKGDGYVVTSGPDAGVQAGPGVTTTPFGSLNTVATSITVPKNGTKLATVPGCITAGDFPQTAGGDAITFHFVTTGNTA